MKYIKVGFSKSKKKLPIGSWLIRFYQQTEFSHCYIKIEDIPRLGSNTIIHASEGKVQINSEIEFNIRHESVAEFVIELPDKTYMAILRLAHRYSGADYGLLQNVGIVYAHIMLYLFKKRVKNPWPYGFNCSEFILLILKKLHPDIFNKYQNDTVIPKELYLELLKLEK